MEEDKRPASEYEEEKQPERITDMPEGHEPPPVPKSIDDQWAERLGVKNNVPPMPEAPGQEVPRPMQRPVARGPRMDDWPIGGGHRGEYPAEPMPSTWLVWSVVCTILCCTIPGIVAIIQSSKVSTKYYAGDLEGAKRSSRNAEIWIIVSFVLGVLSSTLYLPLTLAGVF